MTNKYKISELAKDFRLAKDIIKIVAEKTKAEKNCGAKLLMKRK